MAASGSDPRIIDLEAIIPGLKRMVEESEGLSAAEALTARLTIAADVYLSDLLREGKTLREAGFTATADALEVDEKLEDAIARAWKAEASLAEIRDRMSKLQALLRTWDLED